MFSFDSGVVRLFCIAVPPYAQKFQFSMSSPTIITVCFLFHSATSKCEVVCPCGFDVHFSNDVEHPFMCLLSISISSLEKCSSPLPIFEFDFLLSHKFIYYG